MRKRRNSKKVRSLPFFDEKYLKVRKRIVADDKLKRNFIWEKKGKLENSKSVHSLPFVNEKYFNIRKRIM